MSKSKIITDIKKRNRMISHARELVEIRNNAKWEICKIALQICHIKRGYVPKGAYTITRFAEDIGMNRKTLSCWVLDYEFAKDAIDLDKTLDDKSTKRLNSAISKARLAVTGNNFATNDIDTAKIKEKVTEYLNDDDSVWKIRSFVKNARHQHYYISDLKKSKINKELKGYLKQYSELIDEIKTDLNKLV